jgi:hypothetical protein
MKKIILNLFLFIALLCASSSSYALDFIKLGTGHDVDDFWGTPDAYLAPFPSTIQYLRARGKNQTNPIDTLDVTDENVQDVFAGVYGPFDALVFSESLKQELTPETYGLINSYVSNGGCVIVTGSHLDEADFLNNAFGFSIISTNASNGVDTYSIQSSANGTAFPGGPVGLIAADATLVFSNTPGTTIYSGSTGTAVFTDQVGGGTVSALGWDYCCAPPGSRRDILDWYEVVNRAFDQCTGTSSLSRPIPTLSEWGMISAAGGLMLVGVFFAVRRKRAAV